MVQNTKKKVLGKQILYFARYLYRQHVDGRICGFVTLVILLMTTVSERTHGDNNLITKLCTKALTASHKFHLPLHVE